MNFLPGLYLVTGKMRHGKTLFGMHIVEWALRKTRLKVVTNISVVEEELIVLLRKHRWDGDLNKRLWLLPRENCYQFWRWRGARYVNFTPDTRMIDGETKLIFPVIDQTQWPEDFGCCFIIDEDHKFHDARHTLKLGPEATYWTSEMGKLSDIGFLISQHPERIDVQFKRLCEGMYVIQNRARTRYLGFRGSGVMRAKYYDSPEPTKHDKPQETISFRVDVEGLAKCYRTEEGVGVKGKVADKGQVPPGIDWRWAFPAFAGLLILVFLITGPGLGWAMRKLLGPHVKETPKNLPSIAEVQSPRLRSVTAPPSPLHSSPSFTQPLSRPAPDEWAGIRIRSYSVLAGVARVTLSDGRVRFNPAGHLTPDGLWLADGRLVPMERPK